MIQAFGISLLVYFFRKTKFIEILKVDSRFILVCYFLWELYIFLHLLQHSPSARPPSPPRGLSSVLRSPVLTNDLRSFLADLDEEAGEAEERTRVNWLNFALACKEVAEEEGGEEGASRKLLSKMHKVHMSFGSAAGGRVGNPNGGGGGPSISSSGNPSCCCYCYCC